MKLSSFKDAFADATKSFSRNRTLSIAAIINLTLTLIFFGIILMGILGLGSLMTTMESKYIVNVYIDKDATEAMENKIKEKLESIEGVESVTYVSKENAVEIFNNSNEVKLDRLSGALPASFKVKIISTDLVDVIANEMDGFDGVEDVDSPKEIIELLETVISFGRWLCIVVFALFLGISLFLISNTIRLTIFSRRKEIGIMKYIGATDSYIKRPFVLEGMLIGFLGAIIALLILYFFYNLIYNALVSPPLSLKLFSPKNLALIGLPIYLGFGIFVGGMASIFSIRRFLVV